MQIRRKLGVAVLAIAAVGVNSGCYSMRGSWGGGRTTYKGYRTVSAADVLVPKGYRVEAVARKLNFPSAVGFDDQNRPYVLEAGYSYGEVFTKPRLLRIESDGTFTEIASGDNGPWTGLAWHDGAFYVAQGGEQRGGAIVRISLDGTMTPLIEDLPSVGDHHTNGPAIRDGYVYFGVGTATNAGVVGVDNYEFGWLKRFPDFHDIPAKDIKLIGTNFETQSPLPGDKGQKMKTGAFLPYGTRSVPGQVIKGHLPATGTIMRIPPAGGPLELVAWGLRNPYGIAFSPDGQLYATDNMYDDRGSRKVWGAGDVLWKIEQDKWYGWPDYHAGTPVDVDKRYKPPGANPPELVLADRPETVPQPAAVLAAHGSASGMDFSRSETFGHVGDAFVAEFGDMAPKAGQVLAPVGFDVVRVDVHTGVIEKFAINRGDRSGPASRWHTYGLERPVNLRFDNAGESLYVVDFGVMTVDHTGPKPRQNTGVLWRITREAK